jgi:CP family cyanate transporter-like MFS transporter
VIVLVALNLRAAVTSLGALLDEVNAGLHISPALAGVITMLPALSFAVVGFGTPRLSRRLGAVPLLIAAMGVLAAGQAVRALTGSVAVFVLTSLLALAGIAVANVLMPVLVKQYFPDRIGTYTGVYTMVLTSGTALAAAASVPVAQAAGSWRTGLGVWSLLAAVAIVPLVAMLRRAGRTQREDKAGTGGGRRSGIRPWRTRLGWSLAIFFGAQSFGAYAVMGWLAHLYRDAGFSAETSGLLLSAVMAVSIPVALLMPTLAARRADQRWLVITLAVILVGAYAGLAFTPHSGALAWSALLAVGQGSFPLALVMIGMRARTDAGTVALSAFTQSAGYAIAALGPLVVGVLYQATGGWYAPLAVLVGMVVIQAVAGILAATPRSLEDEASPPCASGDGILTA